jgi:hypothetical protein
VLYFSSVFLIVLFIASLLWTLSLRVPSKLIRDFSIFSVRKSLRSSPSVSFSTVANNIYQFIDVISTKLDDLLCYAI